MPVLLPVAAAWLSAELAFFVYQRWRYSLLSSASPEDACVDKQQGRLIMERLLDMDPVWTLEDFFSGWFRGAPYKDIYRGNVLELTAYGFYNAKPEDLPADLQSELEWYVSQLEKKFEYRFPEGYNNELRYMAHLQEPLRVMDSPLTLHVASEAVTLATAAVLRAIGFAAHRCQGFRYWVRRPRQTAGSAGSPVLPPMPELRSLSSVLKAEGSPASSQHARRVVAGVQAAMGTWDWDTWDWQPGSEPPPRARGRRSGASGDEGKPRASRGNVRLFQSSAPLVFLHGVGLGVTPYIQFIWRLARDFPTRPLVLLECRHISLSLCTHAVTPDAVAQVVVDILQRRRWRQAAFVAHSYGTFVLSRIAQMHRHLVESMVLIDPVCMFTIYPQLLRNFIYKLPRLQWDQGMQGMVDCLRYLVARNLVIAEAFGRKFAWHKVMLWPEEMADVTLLVLSAGDDLVPSALVQAHLSSLKTSCQVICHPTATHGGFLMDKGYMQQVLEAMQQALSQGAVLAAKSPTPSRL